MTTIGYEDFTRMMRGAIALIKQNSELLSRLDAATGDGDHGVTMLRAMNKVETLLQGDNSDLKHLIYEIGWALLDIDGGATGPLLGSLFMGMSDGVGDARVLDAAALAAIFEAGLASLQRQTKAGVGDKTMMDALIPAVAALRQAADEGKPITGLLQAAAQAAEQGALATREFQARHGRARHQGARTLGHQDPGATSTALIFQGFWEGLK